MKKSAGSYIPGAEARTGVFRACSASEQQPVPTVQIRPFPVSVIQIFSFLRHFVTRKVETYMKGKKLSMLEIRKILQYRLKLHVRDEQQHNHLTSKNALLWRP
jgi:hypothetical protein